MNAVMTVRGPVDADQLGMVLMHEHIFINEMIEERSTGLLNDFDLMKQEVGAFVNAEGGTIVELTSGELTSGAAPDPTGRYSGRPSTGYAERGTREPNQVLNLLRLSNELNLHLVLGAGHYRDPFIDHDWFDRADTRRLAEQIVADATVGFDQTGVRAGIIGEVGSDKWYVSATEERSFRAVARAHLATGLTITTHAARWPVGVDQLDILTSAGVDARRIIIGHCDTVNIPEYHQELAERGAFVEFDTVRGTTQLDTERRVNLVVQLIRKGFLGQILLSHDICSRTHLHVAGGEGYDFIPRQFVKRLSRVGLNRDILDQLLVHNPRRALSGES